MTDDPQYELEVLKAAHDLHTTFAVARQKYWTWFAVYNAGCFYFYSTASNTALAATVAFVGAALCFGIDLMDRRAAQVIGTAVLAASDAERELGLTRGLYLRLVPDPNVQRKFRNLIRLYFYVPGVVWFTVFVAELFGVTVRE